MTYELSFVKTLNKTLSANNVLGIAYRLKQAKFCNQYCDILVDSANPAFYLAIECKTTKYGLFFSSNFSRAQVDNIHEFILQSGRTGILALRDRKQDYIIPWSMVYDVYTTGGKGLNKKIIEPYKINLANTDEIFKRFNEYAAYKPSCI